MTIQEAIKTLTKVLREDPGYRIGWQANIAVQFQDEWQKATNNGGLPADRKSIHEISNKAADNFLNLLTRETA